MKTATKMMVAPVLGALAISLMAFAYQGKGQSKEWVVPAADAQKKNPTKADKASTDVGRDIWGP